MDHFLTPRGCRHAAPTLSTGQGPSSTVPSPRAQLAGEGGWAAGAKPRIFLVHHSRDLPATPPAVSAPPTVPPCPSYVRAAPPDRLSMSCVCLGKCTGFAKEKTQAHSTGPAARRNLLLHQSVPAGGGYAAIQLRQPLRPQEDRGKVGKNNKNRISSAPSRTSASGRADRSACQQTQHSVPYRCLCGSEAARGLARSGRGRLAQR